MKSSTNFILPAQSKIDALKKEHGSLHVLKLQTPDGLLQCLVRCPTLTEILFSSHEGGGDTVATGLVQLNACWIDGDPSMKTDIENLIIGDSFKGIIKSDIEHLASLAEQMGFVFRVFDRFLTDIKVTSAIKAKLLDTASIKPELTNKIEEQGIIREITLLVGDRPNKKDATGKLIDERKTLKGYLRLPDMKDREKAEFGGNLVEKGQIFMNECWLYGAEEFRTGDDEIRYAASVAASQLFKKHTVEITKL